MDGPTKQLFRGVWVRLTVGGEERAFGSEKE